MRIKSDTILAGVLIVLGIIIFVGGLRYTFDIIVDPPRDNTDPFDGGVIAICLGLAPLIYGIVTLPMKYYIGNLGRERGRRRA